MERDSADDGNRSLFGSNNFNSSLSLVHVICIYIYIYREREPGKPGAEVSKKKTISKPKKEFAYRM